ncbi:MAG: hypothetical protein ACTSRS_16275 [Candidatus Helarchaeota archaeon]
MEISKFIKDALKDGSIDKVSKGIEQLVMMMINAVGMIEQTQLELSQRIEAVEEDLGVIKDFLLKTPIPLPGSTAPPSTPSPSSSSIPPQTSSIMESQTPPVGASAPKAMECPTSEEDILAFRKKLLKPVPKEEKLKPKPVSIRAALIQEMKEYFNSAMTKPDKKKSNSS